MSAPREILVGVTGGIAAFKTAALVSDLVQSGVGVTVVMTRCAEKFIGEATFRALTIAGTLPHDPKLIWPFYHETALDFHFLGMPNIALQFENEALRLALDANLPAAATTTLYARHGMLVLFALYFATIVGAFRSPRWV